VNRLLLIEPEVKENKNKNKMDMLDIVEVCLEKIHSYSALVSDRVRNIDFSV
jgi:nicotinamide/nicotinate riboside kinase